ncbi:MAG: hypothetical protein PHC31_14080 [Clostridia bacterium]|nr:hypothetical protein [Clostridia bacterium]
MTEPKTEQGVYELLAIHLKQKYPDVIWFFDLSGVRVHQGTKRKIANLRSSTGIPDLIVDEPRGRYHGLRLEIKRHGENPYRRDGLLRSDPHLLEQFSMLTRLQAKGYFATFAVGIEEATKIVDKYMMNLL